MTWNPSGLDVNGIYVTQNGSSFFFFSNGEWWCFYLNFLNLGQGPSNF